VDKDPVDEQIVQLLINSQRPLYAYILTLLPDLEAADDVLQETNLLLWRKAREFVPGTNFFAWACRTAEYQAMAWLRDRKRNRIAFDETLIRELASQSQPQIIEQVERARLLTGCIRRLSERDQALLQRRYTYGMSVTKLAEELGKTVNAVSRSLYRIRGLLLDCIKRSAAT
jgi:RNA polymerase sigma-70 factor (ECF subfamily)